ncbi:unnamed protein product [Mytilus coruscus]|uniref:Cadherin domain-containing protein n=1 Tax=Mytilus coruscus TaxID=42192 RepID=A0A6J8AWL4_MYTCO|nr:unnamed protein product [Mytilus coruscus]
MTPCPSCHVQQISPYQIVSLQTQRHCLLILLTCFAKSIYSLSGPESEGVTSFGTPKYDITDQDGDSVTFGLDCPSLNINPSTEEVTLSVNYDHDDKISFIGIFSYLVESGTYSNFFGVDTSGNLYLTAAVDTVSGSTVSVSVRAYDEDNKMDTVTVDFVIRTTTTMTTTTTTDRYLTFFDSPANVAWFSAPLVYSVAKGLEIYEKILEFKAAVKKKLPNALVGFITVPPISFKKYKEHCFENKKLTVSEISDDDLLKLKGFRKGAIRAEIGYTKAEAAQSSDDILAGSSVAEHSQSEDSDKEDSWDFKRGQLIIIKMAENGDAGQQGAKTKRPVVMPDVFTGEEEWTDWLFQFESCSSLNDWDDGLKCKFIIVGLKGTAEIMGRRKKPSETYLEMGNSIRTLARKAYPSLSNNVRDELVKDKFLRGLDKTELALKIRHANPKTLDEAIRMTLEWEAVEKDVKDTNTASENKILATMTEETGACASINLSKTDELIGLMTEMMKLMRKDKERTTVSSRYHHVEEEAMVEGSEEATKRTCNVGLVLFLAILVENAIK